MSQSEEENAQVEAVTALLLGREPVEGDLVVVNNCISDGIPRRWEGTVAQVIRAEKNLDTQFRSANGLKPFRFWLRFSDERDGVVQHWWATTDNLRVIGRASNG